VSGVLEGHLQPQPADRAGRFGADGQLRYAPNLVRLNVYATDVDRVFEHYGVLESRLGAAGAAPATTMLGVTRLAIPTLLVELEGTAVG
jgi:enamine deaminase RidA (YjgF/YER057c/UK114 family)